MSAGLCYTNYAVVYRYCSAANHGRLISNLKFTPPNSIYKVKVMAISIRDPSTTPDPPKNRNCRRKGCDGKYYLLLNDWNCLKCGHGPYKTRIGTKQDAKEVRRAKAEIARIENRIGIPDPPESETPEQAQSAFNWLAGDSMLVPELEHEPEDPPARKPHSKRYYDSSGNLYAKQCSLCRTIKPACDYDFRMERGKRVINSRCRDCFTQGNHAHYEKNKAKKIAPNSEQA